MMDNISRLFLKQLTGSLTPSEREELDNWMALSEHNAEIGRHLSDLAWLQKEYHLEQLIDTERARADMERRIASLSSPVAAPVADQVADQEEDQEEVEELSPAGGKRRWWPMAAVASVAAITGVFIGFLIWYTSPIPSETGQPLQAERTISLDEVKTDEQLAFLSDESGRTVTLRDNDGEKIISEAAHVPSAEKAIDNKLEKLHLNVPRGKEFKIVLEDSTVVWLNSESHLKYPALFGTNERRVEVEGEAYFQVKRDLHRPFYVVSGAQEIQVYGTTFNVRNYPEERNVFTTLETGSIGLTRHGDGSRAELRLTPGHQAVFEKADTTVSLKSVKTEMITGWRHGKFVFEEQPLSTIMRDLARWYDFEYEFADKEVGRLIFKGSIPRYSNLKTAIEILEGSGGISFTVADNKIIIASE